MEREVYQHYQLLKNYLASYLASLGNNRAPSSAMARVSRLPSEQFFEVSSDLHDELKRRLDNPQDLPFLPIRADLVPKRNQARQKMATLPETRFKELATELFVEIEKRFPQVVADFNNNNNNNNRRGQQDQDDMASNSGRSRSGRSAAGGERSVGNGSRRGDPPSVTGGGPPSRERRPSAANAAVILNGSSSAAAGYASSDAGGRRRQPDSTPSMDGGDRYQRSPRNPSDRERGKSKDPSSRYPSSRSDDMNNGVASPKMPNGDMQEEVSRIRSEYEFKVAMLEKQLKEAKNDDSAIQEIRLLESQLAQVEQANGALQNDYDRLQADYERALKDTQLAQSQNSLLQTDFSQIQRECVSLQDDLDREQKITRDLEVKLKSTKDDLTSLQDDFNEKQKIVEKMRGEAASFLGDIQGLKEKLRLAESERDRLRNESPKIISPIRGAPSPIAKDDFKRPNGISTKGIEKLGGNKNSAGSPIFGNKKSPGIQSPAESIKTIQDKDFTAGDGVLRDFQMISSELLNSARSNTRAQVLGPMKNILLICKKITQDCENLEDDPGVPNDDKDALHDSKSKLSESLTIIMQATKEHASNSGPSLSVKIEKELSHLSFCVSDILELLKIIQANTGKVSMSRNQQRDTLRSSSGWVGKEGTAAPAELPPMNAVELRDYLEEQIEFIGRVIQDLLQAMLKTSTTGDALSALANKIAGSVDNIIYETQGTLDISTNMAADIVADADDIVAVLSDIRYEILDLADAVIDKPSDRDLKQKIANSSYEIAKESKALLSLFLQN